MSANPKHLRPSRSSAGSSLSRQEHVMDESFPAVPDAVTQARLTLVDRLRALGADDGSLDDVALAVSEACTNAVMHAYGKPLAAPLMSPPWSRRISSTSP